MTAQPLHVSYLCFEIGGILDISQAELGAAVNDIPFYKLCDQLKTSKTSPGDPSRLQFDSLGITKLVDNFAIATLRNGDRKAALDSAVNSRQNIFFSKYANAASVISTIRGSYFRTSPASKPNLLEVLNDLAAQQAAQLHEAYTEDERTGVVKATSSSLESSTSSRGSAERGGPFIQESVGRNVGKGTWLPHNLPGAWDGYGPARFQAPDTAATALTVGTNYEVSWNRGSASGTQSATHVDYEYRTPYIEAKARYMRAHISLIDQKFESFMLEQNMPHLEQIFENDLESLDNNVFQLQIALLRSFLISPLAGTVTGIYKNPGDAVSAGEPVIRVENNGIVHLVANLVHHGPIRIGATATVTATLGGASSPATTLTGSVVAARGQESGGRWEVVVKANNVDGAGNHILPLGYCFDAEYTDVIIV